MKKKDEKHVQTVRIIKKILHICKHGSAEDKNRVEDILREAALKAQHQPGAG